MDVSQVKLVDQSVSFGGITAWVLLVEWDRARTIVHLRAQDPTDTTELIQRSRTAVDGQGRALTHLVSLSGGTGVETHVTHVYDSIPPDRLVLLDDSGDAAITIDIQP